MIHKIKSYKVAPILVAALIIAIGNKPGYARDTQGGVQENEHGRQVRCVDHHGCGQGRTVVQGGKAQGQDGPEAQQGKSDHSRVNGGKPGGQGCSGGGPRGQCGGNDKGQGGKPGPIQTPPNATCHNNSGRKCG